MIGKLRVLITEREIRKKVEELAEKIERDYEGKDLLIVGVLKGAFIFIADLIRCFKRKDVEVDFMAVSSYGDGTETSGVVRIIKDLDANIAGRNVLIAEDVVDTGTTLDYIRRILLERKPKSLKICALLDKRERRRVEVPLDYVGFEIPNVFVVGYGLDYAQKYRNLPFIGYFEESEEGG